MNFLTVLFQQKLIRGLKNPCELLVSVNHWVLEESIVQIEFASLYRNLQMCDHF